MDNKSLPLPELLAPAGDMDALKSAIVSGADAIYFGTDLFNARINAHNFNLDNAREAIRLCHAHNVKAFVTLNIAIYDREIPKLLEYVAFLYESGVDALIVSDLGMLRLIKERFPDLEVHASTQASVHNLDGVRLLAEAGCSRVVVARELDKESIRYICKSTNTEIEIFVHGAHCMSMSGQCLMSYAMGGRSGNRGECAQPCRLPYKMCGRAFYPLSLKDMSLATKINEIIDTGVASLKIEGRMKSADYVGGVCAIWRGLLDERKNAGTEQMRILAGLFSRQGFTSGYFENKIDESMLGVRSEEDKATTKAQAFAPRALEKPRVDIFARFFLGERAALTLTHGTKSVTVYADIVEQAINAPMSEQDLAKSLSKLGSTPYQAGKIQIEKSENIIVRISSLNALRREAVDKLLLGERKAKKVDYVAKKRLKNSEKIRSAVFREPKQIPENAQNYFDRIYLPVYHYCNERGANGIYLPPIILDNEWSEVKDIMKAARENGAKYALVGNIGQINAVKELGFIPIADFRFNVFNGHSIDYLTSLGFDDIILSPELSLPQCRDMSGYSVIAYGKIPVMTTFKCVLKDLTECKKCSGYITDRTGAQMYCEGDYGHHTVIYNSVPIYMADKKEQIADFSWHFIFSDETNDECEQIIDAYKNGFATNKKIRRITK